MKYTQRKIKEDEIGDVIPIKEFIDAVDCWAFVPDDGFGYLMNGPETVTNIGIWRAIDNLPKWATHVLWFNK